MISPNKALVAISTIYRKTNVWKNEQSMPYGLSSAQSPIINIVCRKPGVSQNEVVDLLALEKSVVAKSIGKLIDSGYLTREQNANDKRAFDLFPTEKALAVSPILVAQGEKCMELLTTGLTDEEKELLDRLLDKMMVNSMTLFKTEE